MKEWFKNEENVNKALDDLGKQGMKIWDEIGKTKDPAKKAELKKEVEKIDKELNELADKAAKVLNDKDRWAQAYKDLEEDEETIRYYKGERNKNLKPWFLQTFLPESWGEE